MPNPGQNGDRVQLYLPLGPNQHNQHWQLVDVGGGWNRIVCRLGGKVLDANRPDVHNNGCIIQVWDYLGAGQVNQHWQLVDVGGGWSRIICRESGKVLDATKGDVHNNGCPLQLWDYLGIQQINQHWKLNALGDGYYTVENRESGGKIIDAADVAEPPPVQVQYCVTIISFVSGGIIHRETVTGNSQTDALNKVQQVLSAWGVSFSGAPSNSAEVRPGAC